MAKIVISLRVSQVGGGLLEREEHFAGAGGTYPVGSERREDHGESVLDRAGVAQGMQDVGAESRGGVDDGRAGTVALLVVVAEGAVGAGGRLAAATIGFGVSAEGVLGLCPRVHWAPFGETETSRLSPTLMIGV